MQQGHHLLQPAKWGVTVIRKQSLTRNASNFINHCFNHLLANGIVTSCVVICCILFAANKEFGVEQSSVGASADLVNRAWVKINKYGARHIFATPRLVEEGFERARLANVLGFWVRVPIGLKSMLEEIPRGEVRKLNQSY